MGGLSYLKFDALLMLDKLLSGSRISFLSEKKALPASTIVRIVLGKQTGVFLTSELIVGGCGLFGWLGIIGAHQRFWFSLSSVAALL